MNEHAPEQHDMNEIDRLERELQSRVQPRPVSDVLMSQIRGSTLDVDRPALAHLGVMRWAVAATLVVTSALVGFVGGRASNQPDLESIKMAIREELREQATRADEPRAVRAASEFLPGARSPYSRGQLMNASSLDALPLDDRSL